MKHKIAFFLLLLGFALQTSAQPHTHMTVVYLLPMNSGEINQIGMGTFKEPRDIHKTFSKSLVGFWCGAQIALSELEDAGYELEIIARELNGNDTNKLNRIFKEPKVQQAQLIIAPVSKDIFPYVAKLAKAHKIPLANPLSTREEIITDNKYVYKLMPSNSARAAVIADLYPGANIILWGTVQANDYADYFQENGIHFTSLSDTASFIPLLSEEKNNVVIACTQNTNQCAQLAAKMEAARKKPALDWFLNPKILTDNKFDFMSIHSFPLYFFADTYVDENDEAVQVFQYNFIRRFGAVPSTLNFAYQGYDVTHFFIRMISNNFTAPQDFTPLSYHFKFKRPDKSGGAENYGVRLVKMTELKTQVIQ
ncbi:MAG: amino acid ABC transporter substrate-binding protein [Bacteroidales bacterium]|nr:amino acid ABC transporter substrate-binding protein [Bacteroidales bacterium]